MFGIFNISFSSVGILNAFWYTSELDAKKKFLTFENAKDIVGNTIKYRSDPIILDPRNSALGGRIIINLEKLYLSIKKLNLKSSNIKEYYDHSFDIGIPQIDTQKLQNKLFGIEFNFE